MGYNYDLFQWRREQLGYTYEQVAERAGVSKNTAYLFIEGKTNPTFSINNRISDAFGLYPEFAQKRNLKKSQFWRAVVVTAR